MAKITLQTLGRKLIEKRGRRGVRDTAKEIGISHGTLSRLERGYLPDLETFGKVCRWLSIDPGEVLGTQSAPGAGLKVALHCKKSQALAPETAHALAQMIIAAHRALVVSGEVPEEEDL
ncbi:MAG TPA: helix-turn-helix transcriptional regulator [Pyrinomonadaceae bacterium]|nr:helix-turn-helix transcriptional regulator [Pyrinomonadaceae bacterium]